MKKIEVGKEYVTRNGLKVKVYDIAEAGDFPVIAGLFRGGEIHSRSYTVNGSLYSYRGHEFDIVGEWQEPLDFDWSCLPAWTNKYIAMDWDRTWYAYSKMPEKRMELFAWRSGYGLAILIPKNHAPKNFKGNWENSLFKNPNTPCEQ